MKIVKQTHYDIRQNYMSYIVQLSRALRRDQRYLIEMRMFSSLGTMLYSKARAIIEEAPNENC